MQWHWNTDPSLIGMLLLVAGAYRWAVGPLRSRIAPGEPFPTRHVLYIDACLLLFYLAVGSPLDEMSDRFLLTAHMVQHSIIVFILPILILFGLPPWLLRPLFRVRALLAVGRFLTHPIIALLAFNLIFGAWHIPGCYEWALRDPQMHQLEHVMFLVAGILMWWPVLSPCDELPRIGPGSQMLYLFSLSVAQIPLFAILVFSKDLLYPTYETAPRICALTAMEDQVLGGIVMKLIGEIAYVSALFNAFMRWYQKENSAPSVLPNR